MITQAADDLPVYDLTKKVDTEEKKIPRTLNYVLNELGWKVQREKLLKGNKCIVLFCSKKRTGRKCYCSTHARRRDKVKYPETTYYQRLKSGVIRRGIIFEITLEEFKEWCKEVDFIGAKNSAERRYWSVDRKINELGYVKGNLQLMPTNENAEKAWDEDFEEHPATATQFKKKTAEVEEEPKQDEDIDMSEVPF